ncbi:hypothetical protein CGRA01v4_11602 [Colletotrichum graminicola]|nr:hypothetical protein CGRA01v4_11602 [Colletotrichum graminicola]
MGHPARGGAGMGPLTQPELDSRCRGAVAALTRSCIEFQIVPSLAAGWGGAASSTLTSVSRSLVLSRPAGHRFHQTRQFSIPISSDVEEARMTNWPRYVHDELCPSDLIVVALALSEPSTWFDLPPLNLPLYPPAGLTVPVRDTTSQSSPRLGIFVPQLAPRTL